MEGRCMSEGLSIITGVVGTSAVNNFSEYFFDFIISWFVLAREFIGEIKPVEHASIVFGFFQIGICISEIQIMYSS